MSKNNDKYVEYIKKLLHERDKECQDMLERLWESKEKCAKLEGELSMLKEIYNVVKVEDPQFITFGGKIFKIVGFTENVDKGEHTLTVTAEKVV